jgi:hypothetical protein
MKLNLKKILTVITVTILSIITITLSLSYFNPIFLTLGLAKEPGYYVINTKRDFINPTITYIKLENPCPFENIEGKYFEFAIAHPVRQNTGILIAKNNVLGTSLCKNLAEFKELAKTKDLSIKEQNPDKDKFQTDNIKSSLEEEYSVPNVERYYNPGRGDNKHSENLEDFKKLKKGMNFDELDATVGRADIGFGAEGVSKTDGEITYVIKKDGIKFIAVGFDKYPNIYDDAKLLSLWTVDYNRKATEIPIETLR